MLGLFNHQATANPFNVSNVSRQRPAQLRQRSSLVTTSNTGGNTSQASGSNSASSQASNQQLNSLNIIGSGDNSNGSEVETNSDLATFREALIMHSKLGIVCVCLSLSLAIRTASFSICSVYNSGLLDSRSDLKLFVSLIF